QAFAAQQYGGISRYFTSLVRELFLIGEQPRIIAPVHVNRYLEELAPDLVVGLRAPRPFPPGTGQIQEAINVWMTRAYISAWRPHLIHETFHSRFASGPRRTPTVVTVFDMIKELFADQLPAHDRMTDWKRQAVRRADHVI